MKELIPGFQYYMVSQAGIIIRDNKVLIVKTTHDKPIWDIPGGRLDDGEEWEVGFRREMKEELNLDTFTIQDRIDFDIYYTKKAKHPMCVVVYLIDSEQEDFKISFEHTDIKWISENEINDYEYIWTQAPRMLKRGFEAYRRHTS